MCSCSNCATSSQPFSLNDIGCGYGALLSYLKKRHRRASIDYLGVDLSAAMITHAKRLFGDRPLTTFEAACHGTRVADYSVASGIFNVKLDQPRTRGSSSSPMRYGK